MVPGDIVMIKKCGTVCKVSQIANNGQFVMIDLSDMSGVKFRWIWAGSLEVIK